MTFIGNLRSQYSDVGKDLRNYIDNYGGLVTFLASPFTHVAVAISVICSKTWLSDNWSDLPIAVLPSLLGFALAAYALLLAFGDEKFRVFLARTAQQNNDGSEKNLFLNISAIFLHFIVVQIVALVLAVIGHAHVLSSAIDALKPVVIISPSALRAASMLREMYAFCAFTMFSLAITTSLASALNIFHATQWYVMYSKDLKDQKDASLAQANCGHP